MRLNLLIRSRWHDLSRFTVVPFTFPYASQYLGKPAAVSSARFTATSTSRTL